MKNFLPFASLIVLVIFTCCTDTVKITSTYTIYEPVYKTLQEIRSGISTIEPVHIDVPGKIYLYKNYLLLNEPDKGIHIINNQNPSSPKPLKFINIPGNFDMAVKGDILFADSYMDLVTFDIRNMNNVSIIERLENLFLHSFSSKIDPEKGLLTGWKEIKKVEVMEDESREYPPYYYDGLALHVRGMSDAATKYSNVAIAPSVSTGIGGSMARFTIVNNFLYTIDNNKLYVVDISNLRQPIKEKTLTIGWGIETIFPYKNNLFIGTQTGMFIYDISAPASPYRVSTYTHIRSCDPVVVQDTLAYVTLRGGNECGGTANQLDIINIKNLFNPSLIISYPMIGPYGLGIDNSTLFVCDGTAGLKVYNVSKVNVNSKLIKLNLIKTYNNINAFDVIPFDDLLIMIGKDGLFQFDYSNPEKIILLSKLAIKPTSK